MSRPLITVGATVVAIYYDLGIPGPVLMIELVSYDSTWPVRFAEGAPPLR